MPIEQIILEIKDNEQYIKDSFRVKNLGIFGSYAQGLETVSSDIDILVEIDDPSFDDYFEFQQFLQRKLQKKVDLVVKSIHSNNSRLLRNIEKSLLHVI